jgi:RNA polymerase sigma-70 factor (ECF subfamily)
MSNLLLDEELVMQVQRGDEVAFAELMKRYTAKLLRYGRRVLPLENNIGDIVQDVFVTVYQNIHDFDATRRFSPWIYRIAHNAFVDVIRKGVKGPLYFFDFDRIVPHPIYEDPLILEKEKEDVRVLLEKGLKDLSPVYREIIDLYYFENFSYKEIADILHVPLGTVGIRLSRARQVLKKKLS